MDYDDVIREAARALAKSNGTDFDEVCGVEANPEEGYCDSGTCVAAHWEEHEPDVARGYYIGQARAAFQIMAEYGARLMLEAGPDADPAAIVKEAVK